MKTEQALQILKEALNIAIAKGCFGLIETTNIVNALQHLDNQPQVEFGAVEELPNVPEVKLEPKTESKTK